MLVKCLCGTSIAIESRHLGNKIACPQCKRQLRVASGNSDPAMSSDSAPKPTINHNDNPLPKTQPPKLSTTSDDLPLRLRAPAEGTRQASGYYRPQPKKKSDETFKFLVVCGVFLIGICILGGFGLVGLAIYNKNNPDANPVVADNEDPTPDDPGVPENPDNLVQSDVLIQTLSEPSDAVRADNNASTSNSALARAGVRVHREGNQPEVKFKPKDPVPRVRDAASPSDAASEPLKGPAPLTARELAGHRKPGSLSAAAAEAIIEGNGEGFETDPDQAVARSFSTGGTSIIGIKISPNKKYLGANSLAGVAYVFDLQEGGKLLYKIVSDQKLIRAIAFCETGSLYTLRDQESSENNCITIRNPDDGAKSAMSIGEAGTKRATSLAVSMDGRSVFANWQNFATETRTSITSQDAKFWRFSAIGDEVKVFDLERVFHDPATFRSKIPSCSVFTKDGRMLVNGFEDGWVGASSGVGSSMQLVGSKHLHMGPVVDIAISPNGEKMVSGSEDGAIQLTSLKSSSWSSKTLNKGSSAGDVLGVAYSSDGLKIAASLANRTIEIYDTEARKLIKTLQPATLCTDLEFMSNDQFLVAGGKDGKIRILSVK